MLSPEEKVALYDQLISAVPEIDRKGKTIPYCSVNGHMFSQLSKEGDVGLRLSKEEREQFLKKYNAQIMISYGAVIKEYVVVPEDLLKDTVTLKDYLIMSFEYTKTLKPKPTKK